MSLIGVAAVLPAYLAVGQSSLACACLTSRSMGVPGKAIARLAVFCWASSLVALKPGKRDARIACAVTGLIFFRGEGVELGL